MLYIRESNAGHIFLQVDDGLGVDLTFHCNDGMALSDCRTLATGGWAIDDDPDGVLSAEDLEGIPIVAEYDDGKGDFGVIRIVGKMGIRAREYIGSGTDKDCETLAAENKHLWEALERVNEYAPIVQEALDRTADGHMMNVGEVGMIANIWDELRAMVRTTIAKAEDKLT